jgi:hypothetical protein
MQAKLQTWGRFRGTRKTMSTVNFRLDSEMLESLRGVFDEACNVLPQYQQTQEVRVNLATCILKRAAEGGLSLAQLHTYAFTEAEATATAASAFRSTAKARY